MFDGRQPLYPGGPAVERSVTVTWHGNGHPASAFGLYANHLTSSCPTANPADKLDLTISQDADQLYAGTLADFGVRHGTAADALPAHGGSGLFTIAVALDSSADNRYMGCSSTTDLVWIASQ